MIPALVGKVVLVLLGLAASWLDIAFRRLPNWLTLLTLTGGLAMAVSSAGLYGLGMHLAHVVISLLIGMLLFKFRIVGGGDAKFYAAIAGWFQLSEGVNLLLSVALSGLAIFFVWFIWRRLTRKPIRASSSQSDADKLPYGVAIALGAVIQYL